MTNRALRQWQFSLAAAVRLLPALLLIAATSGCGKSNSEAPAPPRTPTEAASQLQQAFAAAPVEVKHNVKVASESLKTANYEQAIQTLQDLKTRKNLSFEQGMAVHQTMVALEQRLLSGVAAGDPNAKRAYELLRKSRQN